MFEAIFKELEQVLPEMLAVAVVADDGIEIETFLRTPIPHEVMSAELNGILRTLGRFQREQDLGRIHEVTIRTEKENILLFSLTEGLFVLVVTAASQATGKARYEVQRRAHLFMELLS